MKAINKLIERNFAADFQPIDRVLIENNKCPHCKEKLIYKAFSNAVEYQAFGVCEPCDYAKHFWTERVELAIAKRKFSARQAQAI